MIVLVGPYGSKIMTLSFFAIYLFILFKCAEALQAELYILGLDKLISVKFLYFVPYVITLLWHMLILPTYNNLLSFKSW